MRPTFSPNVKHCEFRQHHYTLHSVVCWWFLEFDSLHYLNGEACIVQLWEVTVDYQTSHASDISWRHMNQARYNNCDGFFVSTTFTSQSNPNQLQTFMRRAAAYHRRTLNPQPSSPQNHPTAHQSTDPSSPTPTALSTLRLASVGTAALLCMPLFYLIAQNACSPISDLVWSFMCYVKAGLFFAVFWASTVYTPLHYCVLDMVRNEAMCGNKFMNCRAWD
jgi:hypothetical protein